MVEILSMVHRGHRNEVDFCGRNASNRKAHLNCPIRDTCLMFESRQTLFRNVRDDVTVMHQRRATIMNTITNMDAQNIHTILLFF
jgi:hypothetical protein